jgi:hypothetical protein
MQNGRVWVGLSGCAKYWRKVLRRSVMPNFETWSHDNLAKFAAEAYAKMQEQHDQIQQLQNDLKDAIKAYREMNK